MKELNNALNDEKLREQWLKRLLPALAVTIIYFVFVSGNLSERTNKAEESFKTISMKGISEAALPGLQQQLFSVQQSLSALKAKDAEVQAGLAAKAGFLYGQNDTNEAIGRIAQIMEKHRLRITEEGGAGEKKIAELPHSYADLKKWLGEMLQMGESVPVHRIQFLGNYVNTYEALKEIALSDIQVLPLFFSMNNPEDNQDKLIGLKSWTLELWI